MESQPVRITKHWKFPDFSTFKQQRNGIQIKLGDYNCSIGPSIWGEHTTTYQIAISTADVPGNIYVDRVFGKYHKINYKDRDPDDVEKEKEEMYNRFCKEANEFWEKFIIETYLNLGDNEE